MALGAPNFILNRRSTRAVNRGKLFALATMRLAVQAIRPLFPLVLRRKLVTLVEGFRLPGRVHFAAEMLRDLDSNEFHRVLWSDHFAYGGTYELANRFGSPQIQPSRKALCADLASCLLSRNVNPATSIRSIFDVGCSSGYLLRYAETEIFHSATLLRGLDIDRHAIESGRNHLRSLGSRVDLVVGDMVDVGRIIGDQIYDLVLCCGVLMYLDEATARQVVKSMLSHTGRLLGIITIAHPSLDNANLQTSDIRPSDRAFIHNVESMIRTCGGKVVSRRWEPSQVEVSPAYYLIVAEPA